MKVKRSEDQHAAVRPGALRFPLRADNPAIEEGGANGCDSDPGHCRRAGMAARAVRADRALGRARRRGQSGRQKRGRGRGDARRDREAAHAGALRGKRRLHRSLPGDRRSRARRAGGARAALAAARGFRGGPPRPGLTSRGAGCSISATLSRGRAAAPQTGKTRGTDAPLQLQNSLPGLTCFRAEKGFFVRGGAGLSNILIDTGASRDRANGFGILVGAGYALQVASRHNITFTVDYSRQSYSGSSTKPDNSQFGGAYLGYMYRR